jgi:hypothetical protein
MLSLGTLADMDAKHKTIVWIGVGLILLAGIYPPWFHGRGSYDWLFARAYGTARVDFTRLLIEWIMIGVFTAGLYFAPVRMRPFWQKRTGAPFPQFAEPQRPAPRNPTIDENGWHTLAETALDMPEKDIPAAMEDKQFGGLLPKGLQKAAQALIDQQDWHGWRDFMAGAFEDAADAVAKANPKPVA